MTYVVSSLLSTISTLSKNQPALAWLLSWRILSFFRVPRSTAEMSKTSSYVARQQARWQRVKKCHRLADHENLITYSSDLCLTQKATEAKHLFDERLCQENSINYSNPDNAWHIHCLTHPWRHYKNINMRFSILIRLIFRPWSGRAACFPHIQSLCKANAISFMDRHGSDIHILL